jgi:hypothetical protein
LRSSLACSGSGMISCPCADHLHLHCCTSSRLMDRLGDQRGGSEWGPIKILLQRENSAYTPSSQPRIPTRVCQGHVDTVDLPTLGTSPKRSQSGSTTQEATDLAALRDTRRTVCGDRADSPRGTGGRSASQGRTVRKREPTLQ